MTVEIAESSRVEAVYDEAMELIRLGFGVEAYIITDLSSLGDFDPSREGLDRIAGMVGHPVTERSLVVDLAEEYARREL